MRQINICSKHYSDTVNIGGKGPCVVCDHDALAARLAEAERLLRKAPPGSELVELVRRGK